MARIADNARPRSVDHACALAELLANGTYLTNNAVESQNRLVKLDSDKLDPLLATVQVNDGYDIPYPAPSNDRSNIPCYAITHTHAAHVE